MSKNASRPKPFKIESCWSSIYNYVRDRSIIKLQYSRVVREQNVVKQHYCNASGTEKTLNYNTAVRHAAIDRDVAELELYTSKMQKLLDKDKMADLAQMHLNVHIRRLIRPIGKGMKVIICKWDGNNNVQEEWPIGLINIPNNGRNVALGSHIAWLFVTWNKRWVNILEMAIQLQRTATGQILPTIFSTLSRPFHTHVHDDHVKLPVRARRVQYHKTPIIKKISKVVNVQHHGIRLVIWHAAARDTTWCHISSRNRSRMDVKRKGKGWKRGRNWRNWVSTGVQGGKG